jgi:predicted nucleic acid-binding protein
MLVDTDVLIWAARGNEKAIQRLNQKQEFQISAVNYMEFCQGVSSKKELQLFKKTLKLWEIKIIPICEAISYQAIFWVERFSLSHSLCLADALIAATVLQENLVLLTANDKHYSMLKEIKIERFRPE